MKVLAATAALLVSAALIGAVAAAGTWRATHAAPAAYPAPSPTPCKLLMVNDDGTVSCFDIQTYGMEPYP